MVEIPCLKRINVISCQDEKLPVKKNIALFILCRMAQIIKLFPSKTTCRNIVQSCTGAYEVQI